MTHKEPRSAGRRSFYVDYAAFDALAEVVEELHWETRRPKHEVLAAAFALATERPDEIRARLAKTTDPTAGEAA